MDWNNINLYTPVSELPKLWNSNFESVKSYIDIFYNEDEGKLQVSLETTGKIKGATGEFATVTVDNLVVRNQYTNLYDNYTTVDSEYYNTYIEDAVVPRDASTSIFENENFSYIDVNQPYYKIKNDASIAFNSESLGQEFQILFDASVSTVDDFNILIDPSYNGGGNGYKTLTVDASDAETTWITLIAVEFDASWGTTWTVKQYGGYYTIS